MEMVVKNTCSVQRVVLVVLALCASPTAPATISLVLGILWERSVIYDVKHLARSLTTMATLNNQSNVTVTTHDVTGLSQNALQTLVCTQLDNTPEVLFVSAVGCFLQMALRTIARNTGAVVVATTCGCDMGVPLKSGSNYTPYPPTPPGLGPVVADLISQLEDWKDVAMIYDDVTASRADAIIGGMTGTNATLQAFRVRAQQSEADVSAILDDLLRMYSAPRHIILVCSLQCQLKVIAQALEYDSINNVQAHFKYEDRWILVADRFELKTLEAAIGWIDNVAVLVPLTLDGKSTESIVEEAVSLVLGNTQTSNDTSTTPAPPSTPTPPISSSSCAGTPSAIIQNLNQQFQYSLDRMVCADCDAYDVVTMMYTAGGRGASTVGTWSPSGLIAHSLIFPNMYYGLNGRHLRVSTNIWAPFVIEAVNSSLPYQGLSIELLLELSRSANFTFNLTIPEDGKWGGQENGTWNGLVGELQRKEVDLVVAPLSIQSSRKMVVDYAEAYYNEYTTVLAKLPDASATKWSLYISPFKWQVWLALACSIPFTGFIIWSFTRLSPYYPSHKQESGLTKLENAVLYTYGSFFTQGGIHLPNAQSGRFVVGFWWMYCIVVVATYSGNLIAFLTVTISALPFDTLEDMVNQNDIKYGTMKDTAAYNEIKVSHNAIVRRMWEGIQEFAAEDPEVIGNNHDDLINKVLGGGFAYLNDRTGFDLAMSSHCEIQMIKESFMPLPYGVAMQNQSAYERLFSSEVVKVKEGGLITKWKQKWWPRQSFCSRGMVTQAKAVSLEDVQGAYYAAAMLLFIAFVALAIETIVKRCATWWTTRKAGKTPAPPVETHMNGHANGVVKTEDNNDTNVWATYRNNAPENGVGVRDIYTNKEPLVDMFGRSTNTGMIVEDLFSDPTNSMAMVDLLGNPVKKEMEEVAVVDKYSRTMTTETGETVDMFGRPIAREAKVDMFGRPVAENVDSYGRST